MSFGAQYLTKDFWHDRWPEVEQWFPENQKEKEIRDINEEMRRIAEAGGAMNDVPFLYRNPKPHHLHGTGKDVNFWFLMCKSKIRTDQIAVLINLPIEPDGGCRDVRGKALKLLAGTGTLNHKSVGEWLQEIEGHNQRAEIAREAKEQEEIEIAKDEAKSVLAAHPDDPRVREFGRDTGMTPQFAVSANLERRGGKGKKPDSKSEKTGD